MILQINFTYGKMKKRDKEKIDNEKIREYFIKDKEGKLFVNNFKIIEVNMDFYLNEWYNKKEINIKTDKMLIMLGLEKKELEELSKDDKVVQKYMEELDEVNTNPIFRQYMSYEEDQKKIFNSRMKAAEEKGLEKGMKKGIKQGIEKGIEQRNIELAKELLKNENLTIEYISEITNLSIEQLESLK